MIATEQALTKRQAGVVIRRLTKQGIEARVDHCVWGSVVWFTSEGTRYHIETIGQAYRWTGYPDLSK